MTAPTPDNGAEALAAFALIRAYAAGDMYTARHVLARWAGTLEEAQSFASIVAKCASVALARQTHGDKDGALAAADDALQVYRVIRANRLAA
jgi:hypothetical protein